MLGASVPAELRVEPRGDGRYGVHHPGEDPEARNVVFSGQILAQMIMAADHAVGSGKLAESVHAIFARAGSYDVAMELAIDTLQSGRTFASHTVHARQGERQIARGLVLQSVEEPDLMRHTPEPPQVPAPDDLAPDAHAIVLPGTEVRSVPDPEATSEAGAPVLRSWLRHACSFESPAANQAVLAWAQPGFLIGLAMRPHGDVVRIEDAHRAVSTGVVAHTTSFHDRFDVGEWLLVEQEATWAGRGRVFGAGRVFTSDGRMVSTFTQEGMARHLARPLDPKRSL